MANPTMFPCLSYNDAPAAIAWLERAFGFERNVVYDNPDGTIAHAELRLGNGMIMLGSTSTSSIVIPSPATVGHTTMSIYLCLPEVDSLYARAIAAGAEVLRDLHETDYGSKDFTVRDLEGHVWNFGTYDPYLGER